MNLNPKFRCGKVRDEWRGHQLVWRLSLTPPHSNLPLSLMPSRRHRCKTTISEMAERRIRRGPGQSCRSMMRRRRTEVRWRW